VKDKQKVKAGKEYMKKLGPEGRTALAESGGQAALQKYGIEIYASMAKKRWAK